MNAALKAVAKNGPIGNREFRVIVGEYSALNDNVAKATSGWLVCVTFLPEKRESTHFPKYTYQSVLCKHCKQLVGYLYSPMETDPSLVASCVLLIPL